MTDGGCKKEYIRRIHKVQDYIEHHYGCSISVEELSEVAGFSMYHFSRIFQAVLHEPLAHYVNRIRMEQVLFLLAHRTDKNMTDIAYEMGFSDSAVFSRTFKNYFGVSPREYRKEYSKNCKEPVLLSAYNGNTAKKEEVADISPVSGKIEIKELEAKQAVYVRHTGTYESLAREYPKLLKQLLSHAEMQGLLAENQNELLAMYHDNPEFSSEKKFRTSICLTVPKNIRIQEGESLAKMTLEGGLYAVGYFEIKQEQYHHAWDYMYREWLTCSGYVPRNYCPFEVYCNNPLTDDKRMNHVAIYVPVEPFLC